jgi:hydroxymethylpyrimidine pyrophosphatase-like HAD family hydrolase
MKSMLDWSKQRADAFPLDCILSSDEYFEILPSGISKGNAVLQLLESIHLQAGQAAAIGDHLNDLSMLEIVGLPAAVANAHPLVLQQAAVHVPPHHQDGVQHFIQHHLLPHKAKASL